MTDRVRQYIAENHFFSKDGLVLVALSGGADSVALLLILRELGYHVAALHCNFHLRGKESDRDEHFVTTLCKEQHVELAITHFNTKEYAKANHLSIEMAARELRYRWFHEQIQERKAQCVAVAHHQDDQAETVLLNLVRGTGLRGLCGMMARQGEVVRPLLCISRKDILRYLETKKQPYVTDSTNMKRDAIRNRIRIDIIPLLEAINPKASETICHTATVVQQSLPVYETGIQTLMQEKHITEECFPTAVLSEKNIGPTLLYEWLKNKGFNGTQLKEVEASMDSEAGRLWESKDYRLLRDRGQLVLSNTTCHDEPRDVQIKQSIVDSIQDVGPDIAYFDADKITESIQIRKVQKGDRFVPFGMKGSKLISDFLTDRKKNRFQKEAQLVATVGEQIIWVIGERSDNRFRVTEKTTRILKLQILPDL